MVLKRNIRYLQIALNSTLDEARRIIAQLPFSERILIEAGTPLIKTYGVEGVMRIKHWWEKRFFGFLLENGKQLISEVRTPYVVADIKCADLGEREVWMVAEAGVQAATCLGVAPVETLDFFIAECRKLGLDSMIDMMNVETPILILRELKQLPDVVILHRGVDEEKLNPEKDIPVNQIQTIKNSYDVLISIAGGDTFNEVQRAVFNDADIVVVWKDFYTSSNQTAQLAGQFLKEIR